MNETQVKNAIKGVLNKLGIFYFSVGASMYSKAGIADIVGCLPDGRFFAIEVKNSTWKPPKSTTTAYKHYVNQCDFLNAVKHSKGIAFFAQSIDDVIIGLGLEDKFIA